MEKENQHNQLQEMDSLFQTLSSDHQSTVQTEKILARLDESGISKEDPRLQEVLGHALEAGELSKESFFNLLSKSSLLKRALQKKLVIPDFTDFKKDIMEIFDQVKGNTSGKPDEDIPHPGDGDEPPFAVSVCTVDGQLLQLGDHHLSFTLQSICKPINYAIALEETGEDKVHQHVGVEPGSENFDKGMVLNENDLPHNPMINSGSIMCDALIKPDQENEDRLKHVQEFWKKLCGEREVGYDKAAFDAEMESSDKNFALTYLMNQRGAFPKGTDLHKTVVFHNQCCSISVNIDSLAHAAATLAKFGVCPSTGRKVFEHDTVKKMLSLMMSSGMYDHSGEFAFWVGMPAKSGIAGGLMVVIPDLLGISVYSPPLDEYMNSVRGVEFCEKLVQKFNFHKFDSVHAEAHGKIDPRHSRR